MSNSNRDINAELRKAALDGNIEKVKSLISEGADVNAVDTNHNNSLYWAVKNDHLVTAKVLLDNGADLFTFDFGRKRHVLNQYEEVKAEHCKVSLHLAARLGKLEAVKDLLGKEANVNAQNDKGETPLHSAVEVCYVDIPYQHKDSNWSFPTERKCGNVKIVEALLGKKETNINAQDNSKKTPLHYATQNNNEGIVMVLIEAEANVNITDKNRETPLHLAARNKNTKIVVALIEAGADVSIINKNEEIPLDLATDKKIKMPLINAALLKAVQEGNVQKVEHLIKAGAEVNIADKEGKTPLYYAIQKENFEMLIALIKARAKVNAVGNDEMTPLHWAVCKNNSKIVDVLIQVKAGVNAQDDNKKTPLHYAAQNNNEKIVVALIKAGANINVKDKDGKTPFDLATDDKIKTLLQNAEKPDDVNPVDGSSIESEGVQEEEEEEEEEEKQVAEAKPGPDVIKKEDSEEESQRKQDISGEKGTDVTTGSAQPVAPTESNAPIQSGDVQGTTSTGEEGTAAPTQNNGSTTSAEKEQPSSLTDSKGGQEEEKEEKQEGDAKSESDIIGQDSDNTEPQSDNSKEGKETSNTSAEQGTGVKAEDVKHVAPTEPAQTEEQPSSFFGSLFSILMKPFSLIASFFGGFFSWLFGSDEPIQSSSESDQSVVLESLNNSGDHDII